jgi:type I restriction enzyme, S subunit
VSEQSLGHTRYKESGVDWVGRVPEHWQLLPARVAVTNLVEKNEEAINQDYLSLVAGRGVIPYADKGDMGNKKPDDLSKCKIVHKGNIVINSMNFFIGSYGMSEYEGVCSPVYIVLDVNQFAMERRFALRIFGNTGFQLYLATFGDGILKHRAAIGWDDIKGTYLPVPPLEEQTQIAKFLDYETAKIDALIEKQQQLIALLKEKRQAVISHAVTKGLNPDAPMRDSGVEWLGEVPTHWEVKRLKHLFAEPLRNGVSPQAAETGGAPTFSIAAVRDGVVDIGSHVKHADISAHAARPYRVQQGDVMMMRGNGSRDLVGSVGIVNAPPPDGCIYPDILIRLRLSEEIDSQLAVLFLNSTVSRPQVAMGAKTAAGIWKVSGATVAEFTIPVPPSGEQAAIRDHLNLAIRKVDDLAALVESQGTFLQERRTALISAAVTGKIDVRGWKVPASKTEAEAA